jgi:hypothetical protein
MILIATASIAPKDAAAASQENVCIQIMEVIILPIDKYFLKGHCYFLVYNLSF